MSINTTKSTSMKIDKVTNNESNQTTQSPSGVITKETFSDIEVGHVFKNYKELCKQLGLEVKAGKSKVCQMKEISRFISLQKEKVSFIVADIYEEPLEKNDLRSLGNNSIYIHHIELELLSFLKANGVNESGLNSVDITFYDLCKELGLVNENYGEKNLDTIVSETGCEVLTWFDVDEFYCHSDFKLRSIISSALESLNGRRVVNCNKVLYVVDGNSKPREATKLEEVEIMKIEAEVIEDMGLSFIKEVFLKRKGREFHNKVKDNLKKRHGIDRYYPMFRFSYMNPEVSRVTLKLELEKENNRIELNNKIVSALTKNTVTRYRKNINTIEEKKSTFSLDSASFDYRKKGNYIAAQNRLILNFIKLNK